ncbi:type 1 glutamine amidotransferase-like domain-containing protein [Candidatus Beckwithbacteria bacterium]|nr:type 1 glutamine amidotransferase-like domain-containing protein [Candidatus Beckwithbacteria bacterium]
MLILTSSGKFIIQNNINQYLPKKITDCKIAYISTASKKVHDDSYAKNFQNTINKLNFSFNDIDIAGMNEGELRKALDGHDIIFVEGGNTYYLLKSVRDSNFEKVIKEKLSEGVVYIGSSAGSYITGPSIIMSTFNERGFDRFGITDFTAMNIVPFLLKAHYTPDMMERLKKDFSNTGHPLRILTDKQALIINNGAVQLLGEGDEIIL